MCIISHIKNPHHRNGRGKIENQTEQSGMGSNHQLLKRLYQDGGMSSLSYPTKNPKPRQARGKKHTKTISLLHLFSNLLLYITQHLPIGSL